MIAGGAFLLSMFVLIGDLYTSQTELRRNADLKAQSENASRARAVGDFLSARRRAAVDLATSSDVTDYIANRDLGMSAQYGLFANLAAIERRFQTMIADVRLREQPINLRVIFYDEFGVAQVDSGEAAPVNLANEISAAAPKVWIDEGRRVIVAVAPVTFKGRPRGAIAVESELNLLIGLADAPGLTHPFHFLLTADGELLLPHEPVLSPIITAGAILAGLPEGHIAPLPADAPAALAQMLALRTPVGDTGLSVVLLASEDDVYGRRNVPISSFYLGIFAIVLFIVAVGYAQMQRNAEKLRNKFVESNRRRAELAEHNQALSDEIARREAIEGDLERERAALDITNAQLRIAAAAFEAQEGMIVSDARGVILSANHAFLTMTGYDRDEVVGATPAQFRAYRRETEFYQKMWATLEATGGWQGEMAVRARSGEILARWLAISVVRSEAGEITNYIGAYYDISELKNAEEKIRELAFYDQLTGLPNRTLLIDRMRQAVVSNGRSRAYGALLFIDIDNFKTLNDTLGHDMGDLLLKKAAQRLRQCVRAEDTVARFGGDEFVVLLGNLETAEAATGAVRAEAVGEKILASFTEPYQLNLYEYPCTPSIGVALFSPEDQDVDELLKRADLAMYDAKTAGRNGLRFFDPVMQTMISSRAALETDLREDLRKGRLLLHFQPQIDHEGRLLGAEALARWPHPQKGFISPAEFIPVAESTGLILPLGAFVLESACRRLAEWNRDPALRHLTIAVNVSALQMRQKNFVEQTLATVEKTGADPRRLQLELTESTLVSNIEDVIAKMDRLKAAGIGFALDDFGTGYSSLSYLKRLPLDQLKIDRSFVKDVLVDPNDAAIARMIIALGQSLGLDVVAEGVETEEQYAFLADQGRLTYQGFLFSRPLPVADFEIFAKAFRQRGDSGSARLRAAV